MCKFEVGGLILIRNLTSNELYSKSEDLTQWSLLGMDVMRFAQAISKATSSLYT